MNRKVSSWLFFADSDLKLAEKALEEEIFHLACFHANQAVEKYLKAVLALNDLRIPKIHSLSELYLKTVDLAPEIKMLQNEIVVLNKYYIPTRYPDALPGSLPEGLPTKIHAETTIETAEKVAKIVKNFS